MSSEHPHPLAMYCFTQSPHKEVTMHECIIQQIQFKGLIKYQRIMHLLSRWLFELSGGLNGLNM